MSMCSKGLTLLSAVAAMSDRRHGCGGSTALAAPVPLEGVWRTVEVVIPSSAQTFKPGATLAIFHGRHYSRVEVHARRSAPGAEGSGGRIRERTARQPGVRSSARLAHSR